MQAISINPALNAGKLRLNRSPRAFLRVMVKPFMVRETHHERLSLTVFHQLFPVCEGAFTTACVGGLRASC
jgi:hypothetical protein